MSAEILYTKVSIQVNFLVIAYWHVRAIYLNVCIITGCSSLDS